MRESAPTPQSADPLTEETMVPIFQKAHEVMDACRKIRSVNGVMYEEKGCGVLRKPHSPTQDLPFRGFILRSTIVQVGKLFKPRIVFLLNSSPRLDEGIFEIITTQQFYSFESFDLGGRELKSLAWYDREGAAVVKDDSEFGPLIRETVNNEGNIVLGYELSNVYKERVKNLKTAKVIDQERVPQILAQLGAVKQAIEKVHV